MPMTTVQLNHSSNEKPFVIGNGYFQANNHNKHCKKTFLFP